jgi:uncharacterized protein YhjY with autotransporter beta-barrel domain
VGVGLRHADDFGQYSFLIGELARFEFRVDQLAVYGEFKASATGWFEF